MKFLETFFKGNKGKELDKDIIITKSNKKEVCDTLTQIENNREILNFYSDNITDSIKNNRIGLSTNISDNLTEVFGKHNLSKRLEYNTKVWILNAYDLEFVLFCSKRGTDIAICDSWENVSSGKNELEILSFLVKIYELINK